MGKVDIDFTYELPHVGIATTERSSMRLQRDWGMGMRRVRFIFTITRMENIVLRMTYRGSSVDVKIEDTDKSVLLDVIVEMYEAAEAAGMNLPKHPSLSYKFKKKCVKLLDDKGLMEMFSRMGSTKQIDIIIGQDPTPSTVLMLARKLSEADTEDVGANVEGSEGSEGSDDVVEVAGDNVNGNVDVVEIGGDVDGGVDVIEVEGNVKTNVDVVEVGGNDKM